MSTLELEAAAAVEVEAVKMPEDSDNHLLQAAATEAAAAATALLFMDVTISEAVVPSEVTLLAEPLRLVRLYSSRTIILSRSDEPDFDPGGRCLLGGALKMVLDAPSGMGVSLKKNILN